MRSAGPVKPSPFSSVTRPTTPNSRRSNLSSAGPADEVATLPMTTSGDGPRLCAHYLNFWFLLVGREQQSAVDGSLPSEMIPSTSSESCHEQFGKLSIAASARAAIVRPEIQTSRSYLSPGCGPDPACSIRAGAYRGPSSPVGCARARVGRPAKPSPVSRPRGARSGDSRWKRLA